MPETELSNNIAETERLTCRKQVMDPIRVATVGVQADMLDSPDDVSDEEISVGPIGSPCHGSLVMDGCETAYLSDNSIEEEVVVVADNTSDSLSAMDSLDSPGSSSSQEMAPSYFLASCGPEEKRLTFSQQPTLFLAAQGESSNRSLDPGIPLVNLNEERDISSPATVIFSMTKDERKDFYRTVAKGLNRPLFSVYRRVIRMYDNKNHIGKYSSEELDQIKEYVGLF
ncbi:hypothetical protein HPB51_002613 [Rhipicephalus microplus]|uniref:Uncharacterized protein n=1 Tax=Rhipicephalus microplus TaxID=6941 RepID=A0A9J6DFC8_RHIMP|nr:hypothetical protein HPB51_002613 [Rhipicephalus microplus]